MVMAEEDTTDQELEVEEDTEDFTELECDSDLIQLEEEVDELKDKLADSDLVKDKLSQLKDRLNKAQEIEKQLGKMEEELVTEKEEKEKYINRLQRLQADFSNYKKRVAKEKKRLTTRTTKDFVADMLPIIDNFERALATSQDSKEVNDVLEGVEMIHRQVVNLLDKNDVEVIETVGEEFDPNLHEAVMNEPSDEYDSGIITEELQKGYKLDDVVIRPAMVKIAE
ncbi:nucleotide exchange factor GrpE [Halanaerocella petrolearia]